MNRHRTKRLQGAPRHRHAPQTVHPGKRKYGEMFFFSKTVDLGRGKVTKRSMRYLIALLIDLGRNQRQFYRDPLRRVLSTCHMNKTHCAKSPGKNKAQLTPQPYCSVNYLKSSKPNSCCNKNHLKLSMLAHAFRQAVLCEIKASLL